MILRSIIVSQSIAPISLFIIGPLPQAKSGDPAIRCQISGHQSGLAVQDAVVVRESASIVVHRKARGVFWAKPHTVDIGWNVNAKDGIIHHVTFLYHMKFVLKWIRSWKKNNQYILDQIAILASGWVSEWCLSKYWDGKVI